jgi:hypothetical protein
MIKSYSGHSLVSDVTPWWWTGRWDRRRHGDDAVRRALTVISSLRDDVESVNIARDSVRVQFAVGDDDATRVQDKADALRTFLDDIVRTPVLAVAN